jgi:septal ring factor EnvC (AmiA/AmiB activator)
MAGPSDFDVTTATARRAALGRGGLVAALVLGLVLGGALTGLWLVYGSAPPNASNETTQAIKDLQATDQRIAGQLQSVQQTLASEQAETKRLSDQVTALSGKLDALQQSFASAQQRSSPAPSEPATAPAKKRR